MPSNWKSIHTWMLVCAALAAGLPNMEAAFPAVVTPFLKGGAAIFVLMTAVLGAVSPSAGNGAAMAAKTTTILLMVLGLGSLLTTQTGCPPQSLTQVASDVTVGLEAAQCVFDTYSADVPKNYNTEQVIADVLVKCSKYALTEAQVSGLLGAHQKAEMAEKAAARQP